MTFEEAIKALGRRGLQAHVQPPSARMGPHIMGGLKKVDYEGILGYEDAFLIREEVTPEGEDGYVVRTAYPGNVGQEVPVADLKTAVDVVYQIYRTRGAVPAVPTSTTWEEDATALVEMGAKSVDVDTVKGLLSELKAEREKLRVIREKLATVAETLKDV